MDDEIKMEIPKNKFLKIFVSNFYDCEEEIIEEGHDGGAHVGEEAQGLGGEEDDTTVKGRVSFAGIDSDEEIHEKLSG